MGTPSPRTALIGGTMAILVGAAHLIASSDGMPTAEALIERIAAQTSRAQVAVHATRELRAGTIKGKHQGWMRVDTRLTPDGFFSWRVLGEGGSERTRSKVFRELLSSEAEALRPEQRERVAFTPENYELTPLDRRRDGTIVLRLVPRREDASLVNGTLTVTPEGHPLRVEGRLAKSPSFWVKSVTVVRRYARFNGVSLPVTVESLADLKFVGQATFTMRYQYLEVNGHRVNHHVASSPLVGPSPEILALFARSGGR